MFNSILCVFLGLHLSTAIHLTMERAEVRFESQLYETSEESNQQVCLLKSGYTYSSFSVLINTHAAVADESDYTPLQGFQVHFQPGTSRTCFTVNIVNDLVIEEKESFVLSLHEPTGGLRTGITINTQYNGTVIKIVDNDSCTYGPFTNWAFVPGTIVPAPLVNCSSTGQAQVQSRNQTAPQSGCPAKIQRRLACTQTQAERLIRTFNLGPSTSNTNTFTNNIHISSVNQLRPLSLNITGRSKRQASSAYCSSTRMCQNMPTTPRSCTPQEQCVPDHSNVCQTRSMVFVLDTSGSIGRTNFRRMTNAISNFVPLFCDNIQVAIISHSHNINVEFCFNCHNLCRSCNTSRTNVQSAIQAIQYRGGATHTGVATRCVKDYILDPSWGCGVNTSADCLDIIYVTDGHSNGPLSYPQSCEEATCLKNHPNWCGRVNIYAIAIGNGVNRDEIDCLTQHNENSVFEVFNFVEFENLVSNAHQILANRTSGYECVDQRDINIFL